MVQLKRKVHNAPWYHCLNENAFSNRLNQEYDNSAFRKSAGKLFHTLVVAVQWSCPWSSRKFGRQSMSSCQQNTAVLLERRWQADNHRQGIPGQDRIRTGGRASLYLEHHTLPDRQLVQLTKHWWNMVGSLSARYQPGGSILYGLQATEQFIRDAKNKALQ